MALGIFRDGALASHVVAPESACHPISDDVPAQIAALVEPLACVMNGTNRAAVRPGESAVVFGAGAIGCLFTAVLSASGASPVIVVEPRRDRAAVALALGASVVVTPDELEARRAELLPDGADVVVDAVGSVLAQAIDIAAQSGRLVIFGMNSNARPPIHQTVITEKGLTIMGSYITNFTFPPAIKLVESGAGRPAAAHQCQPAPGSNGRGHRACCDRARLPRSSSPPDQPRTAAFVSRAPMQTEIPP